MTTFCIAFYESYLFTCSDHWYVTKVTFVCYLIYVGVVALLEVGSGEGKRIISILDLDFHPANDLFMTLIDLGVWPLPGDGVQHAGAGQVQRAGQHQAGPRLLRSIVLFIHILWQSVLCLSHLFSVYDNLFSVYDNLFSVYDNLFSVYDNLFSV